MGRAAFYPRAGAPGRPGPPRSAHATVRGSRVSLDCGPPLAGAEPAFYVLDAGSMPWASNIASGMAVDAGTSLGEIQVVVP